MTKQYCYIWTDPKKKWWVAKEFAIWIYWIETDSMNMNISSYFVENEPTLWEEVEVININMMKLIEDLCYLLIEKEETNNKEIEQCIKKHLWIKIEDVKCMEIWSSDRITTKAVIEMFKERNLLLD